MAALNNLYEKDKPREKFLAKGASALKEYELLDHIITRDGYFSFQEEGLV